MQCHILIYAYLDVWLIYSTVSHYFFLRIGYWLSSLIVFQYSNELGCVIFDKLLHSICILCSISIVFWCTSICIGQICEIIIFLTLAHTFKELHTSGFYIHIFFIKHLNYPLCVQIYEAAVNFKESCVTSLTNQSNKRWNLPIKILDLESST